MRIHELTENLASTIAKGAAAVVAKSAPAAVKTAPVVATDLHKTADYLFSQFKDQLSLIQRISADPRNPRSLNYVIDHLMNLHQDIYRLKQGNQANQRIAAEVERLADDLQRMIVMYRSNAQQPGAASMLLHNINQELVPVLTDRLRAIQQLIKNLQPKP
jgi:hypothetical protein